MDMDMDMGAPAGGVCPEDGEFWLPPKFLADHIDDSSDEDDFFAALSRRFAPKPKPKAKWAMAGSPQSTLSWSAESSPQVTSPPPTPFSSDNDTWQLIYAAADRVARLKMASANPASHPHPHGRGLLANPNLNMIQFGQAKPIVPAQSQQQQWARQRQPGIQYYPNPNQNQIPNRVVRHVSVCGYEGVPVSRCGGRPVNLPQQAWPHLARPAPAAAAKRECAGTGVFLPRRYNNNNNNHPAPEPRKKTSGCPNVVLPAKVVQALNMSFEDMTVNSHSHPRFGCGFTPDYESLMARRNAMLEQQRRNLRPDAAISHELRLPQDWTY